MGRRNERLFSDGSTENADREGVGILGGSVGLERKTSGLADLDQISTVILVQLLHGSDGSHKRRILGNANNSCVMMVRRKRASQTLFQDVYRES